MAPVPGMTNTPRTVDQAVRNLWGTVDGLGARATWYGDPNATVMSQPPDLLVVDEADRLKTPVSSSCATSTIVDR